MKLKKVLIYTFLLFAIFIVLFVLLFIHFHSYKIDKSIDLNNYFTKITSEDILNDGTKKYHSYYTDLDFNYGDVIIELSEYDYSVVSKLEAMAILLNKESTIISYQVGIHLYADLSQENTIINIIYFSFDNTNYALAIYRDDSSPTNKSITLYKTDSGEYPLEFSDTVFYNHGELELIQKTAQRYALRYSFYIIIALIFLLLISVICKQKKDNKKQRRSKKRRIKGLSINPPQGSSLPCTPLDSMQKNEHCFRAVLKFIFIAIFLRNAQWAFPTTNSPQIINKPIPDDRLFQ